MEQEKPLGQLTPPGFVEVKHIVTPDGKVLQTFLPARRTGKHKKGRK